MARIRYIVILAIIIGETTIAGVPDGQTAANRLAEAATPSPSEDRLLEERSSGFAAGSPADQALLGVWESASCGARDYPRRIHFHVAGRFTASDLVAPCPAGVHCIWSGVVTWQGSWRLEGEEIVLEIERVSGRRDVRGLPKRLFVLSRQPLTLGEQAGDGSVCPYRMRDS